MNKEQSSVLIMEELLFEKIHFDRKGPKNESELEVGISISIGASATDDRLYKVEIEMNGNKQKEYSFIVSVAGVFRIDENHGDAKSVNTDVLLNKNAVAILMPYLRTQITLLTSQPGVEAVVLPPINVDRFTD